MLYSRGLREGRSFFMLAVRLLAVLFITGLWSAAIWVLVRRRKIMQEMAATEARPRPVPNCNFLLLVAVVLVGLSGLVLSLGFS